MWLYLMRHGNADYGAVDEQRELSTRGLQDVTAVARDLKNKGISVDQIHHSTLVRARQTAEIMASALNPTHTIEERPGIEPWGDIAAFVQRVEGWTKDTLVCGHEPFMGEAALALQMGRGKQINVKTATVMAFERVPDGKGWRMSWMINPKILKG